MRLAVHAFLCYAFSLWLTAAEPARCQQRRWGPVADGHDSATTSLGDHREGASWYQAHRAHPVMQTRWHSRMAQCYRKAADTSL